jgi:hypothetical protein
MAFACVPPCTGSFSTRGGLTRHQNVCTTFRASQELSVERRRITSTRIKQSRPHRLRPLQPDSQGSTSNSTTATQPIAVEFPLATPEHIQPGLSLPIVNSSKQAIRLPLPFQDELPANSLPIPIVPPEAPLTAIQQVILHVYDFFRSGINQFHILREYHHRPSYDPDAHVQPDNLANFVTDVPLKESSPAISHPPPPWPFENMSKYLLMNWFHTGGNQKSEGEVNRLVKEVIGAAEFRPADLANFSVHQANQTLDQSDLGSSHETTPFSSDGWREVSVDIEIPVPSKNTPPKTFSVPGLHSRSIIQIIKAVWGSISSAQFHLTPFKRIHINQTTGNETRIYDEVYTSDVWIDAHDKLQKQPNEPGCQLEKVIAGLMFWSDSTHLTSFGTSSVWPVYMYFANLSKYIRAKPNSGACHHVAYIPYVSFLHISFY